MKRSLVWIALIFILFSSYQIQAKTFEVEKEYMVVEIKVYDGPTDEESNEVVDDESDGVADFPVAWINAGTSADGPSMPDIRIVMDPKDKLDDYKLRFKLEVEYDVNITMTYDLDGDGHNDVKERNDTDNFPDSEWHTIGTSETKEWDVPLDANFIGGTATLEWQVLESDNSIVEDGEYVFYIRGENAENSVVEAYIDTLENARWYYVPVVRHESYDYRTREYFNQFFPLSTDRSDFGPGETDKEGAPIWGGPNGWGMMQLDPPPNKEVLWNWQENVNEGIDLLENKRVAGINWLKRQLSHAIYFRGLDNVPALPTANASGVVFNEFTWSCDPNYINEEVTIQREVQNATRRIMNDDDIDDKNSAIQDASFDIVARRITPYITIPDNQGRITLIDGSAIKRYNGGTFIYYNNGRWSNPRTAGYVTEVCSEYELED